MSYRVGQVLFVVLNKKMQVYPMMVVEEITKRTMRGEETNYVLQGGSDSSTTILLNQVDGEIFESADEAKYVLTNRATAQIEKIVDDAVVRAAEWYSSPPENESTSQEVMSLSSSNDPAEVKIELPDGTVANLKNFGLAG
jgi:hypothetical protein